MGFELILGENYNSKVFYYNKMQKSGTSQTNFLFAWPEQQNPAKIQQQINKRQEANSHNYLINMQNNTLNIPSHHSFTQPIHIHDTILVKIQPMELQPQQDQGNFILQCSQNSETSREESSRTQKDQEETAENKNKMDFNQDLQAEDLELSPQSSLRKLYKIAKTEQAQRVYKYEPRQRLIKSEINEKEEQMHEQQEEYYQEEVTEQIKYKQLHSTTLRALITFPVLPTKMIKCVVRVTENRFFSLQSIFDLYLYQEKRHLLRAKKKRLRTYFDIFGKEKDQLEEFAKVKSNFTRTQYKLLELKKSSEFAQKFSQKTQRSFQMPFSSQLIKIQPVQEAPQILEKEDCYLAYQSNFLGFSQQRLTLIKSKKNALKSQRFSDLKNCYQNCEYSRFQKFTTRLAEKRSDGNLILDFKQKNLEDSSKNMIMEDQNGEAGLMFAKMKDNLYLLNVMHPFTILQGFFLALCNLDRKLLSK